MKENSFQFCSSNYLQSTHGTAMGTKIAVSFANALERGYLAAIVRKYLSEVKFAKRKTALKRETNPPLKKTIKFCYTILLSLTEPNENTNKEIAPYTLYKTKEPPLKSHRKGNTLRTYSLERSSESKIT